MSVLPEFDKYGNLPRGVYSLTIEEIVQQLGTRTPKRRWLGQSDIFWVKSDIGQEAIELFIETYQLSKNRRWRGIIEVKL